MLKRREVEHSVLSIGSLVVVWQGSKRPLLIKSSIYGPLGSERE